MAVRAIRPDGAIVLFGTTDQQPAKLTLIDFIGHEGARILSYFSYASADAASIGNDLATLADLVAGGRLRPTVGTVVGRHEAGRGLTALRSGEVAGKAVLTITANGHATSPLDAGEGAKRRAARRTSGSVRKFGAVIRRNHGSEAGRARPECVELPDGAGR